MKTIAICNRKGGTGKTTITVNLAACLDRVYGKKVLVIDCDTQCNTTSYLRGDETSPPKTTLSDYFKHPAKTVSKMKTNEFINQVQFELGEVRKILINSNIYLIAGSKELDFISIRDDDCLKKLLEQVKDDYDYCIMDCPPGVNGVSVNGLCAADCIIVPLVPGPDSVHGYEMMSDMVDGLRENGRNDRLYILGIVLNNVGRQSGLDEYYSEIWDSGEGASSTMFNTHIHTAAVIKEAREFCRPLHYYKRACPAAKEYQELVCEIIERLEEN